MHYTAKNNTAPKNTAQHSTTQPVMGAVSSEKIVNMNLTSVIIPTQVSIPEEICENLKVSAISRPRKLCHIKLCWINLHCLAGHTLTV